MSRIDDAARNLLERRFIGSLGTINPDRSVHLVAVWYMFDENRVLIPTGSSSRKAYNIRRTPTATLMVDERNRKSMSGVVVSGPASVIEGPEAFSINNEIHRRYLSTAAVKNPTVREIFEGDDVTLAISCDSAVRWNMADAIPQIFGDSGLLLEIAN